jgi:hypothetical protein
MESSDDSREQIEKKVPYSRDLENWRECQIMNASESSRPRFIENLSSSIVFCGVLTLGVGGFFLLCLIAYAMVTGNLALGVLCGLLLFSPYILGVVWVFTLGTSLWAERVPTKAEEIARASAQT